MQGSVEVLNEMLPKLSNDQVKLKVMHASVGAVTETDVLLASASNAMIVAFNVRPERKAADLAQREGVDIRPHTIIYEVLDELNGFDGGPARARSSRRSTWVAPKCGTRSA